MNTMNKEQRKSFIEQQALRTAMEVLNDGHYIVSCLNDNITQKMIEGYEKCLLGKYHIKSLKFDGYDYVRVHTFASFSENKQKKIMKQMKEQLPKIELERQCVEKRYEEISRLAEEDLETFQKGFWNMMESDPDTVLEVLKMMRI